MYGIKENKCLEEIVILRFQETLDMEAGDRKIRGFHDARITGRKAVIVNFSGTFYQDVTFDTVVEDGNVQVIVTNNGDGSFPLTYNVTVI
jgi:hypothetical protein